MASILRLFVTRQPTQLGWSLLFGLNTLLFGAQLTQLNIQWIEPDLLWRVALLVLLCMTALVLALGVLLSPRFHAELEETRRWWLAARSRAWLLALMLYLSCVLFAQLLAPLTRNHAELVVIAGTLNAATLLLGIPSPSLPPSPSVDRRDRLTAGVIFLITLLHAGWFFLYAPPGVAQDSRTYFNVSQQLLGHENVYVSPEQPGYLATSIVNYGYGLLIAASRLIVDSAWSIVLLQHGLTALVAVGVFWILRRTDYFTALACGLLLALSAHQQHWAHHVLTESVYINLMLVLAILGWLTLRSNRFEIPALLTGLVGGLIPSIRPAGLLAIVVTTGIVLLWSRSPRRVVLIVAGFVIAVLVIAAGQWMIDRRFVYFTSNDGFYYAFPAMNFDLYHPSNGPASAELFAVFERLDCNTTDLLVADGRTYQEASTTLRVCYRLDPQTFAPLLRAAYFEGIRARPLQFVNRMYHEMRQYIVRGEAPLVQIDDRLIFDYFGDMPRRTPARECTSDTPDPIYQQFACTYSTVGNESYWVNQLPTWLWTALPIMQPYRLLASGDVERFWGALLLLVFVLRGTRPSLRPLVLLCAALIGYSAAVTAFAQLVLPRYMTVTAPLFLIIVGHGIGALLSEAASAVEKLTRMRWVLSALAVGAFGLIALAYMLPIRTLASQSMQPIGDYVFDSRVQVLNYQLHSRLDGRAELVLAWRVLEPLGPPHRMFVHLLDEEGHIYDQGWIELDPATSEPGSLQFGQLVFDVSYAPRPYRLVIGMTAGESLERLILTNSDQQWIANPGDNTIVLTIP